MAKWADYLISGVWKVQVNESKRISHVMLHKDNEAFLETGIKKTEQEVISLLKEGKKIKTIRWDYDRKIWIQGANVVFETQNNKEYLRSVKDTEEKNNLENLISMSAFF